LTWLSIPPAFQISLGVHVDSLSWIMIGVVFLVSLLVQIYSLGYMKGEGGFARYFAYLSLFTASMLGLVTADNLFQLYVCWELVGICSYLLIGFWWHKPSAASAAKKAFVVTRFGDVGFLLGVLMLSSLAGSFRFDAAGVAIDNVVHGHLAPTFMSGNTFLWLVPVLLFCGAIGKSAQFPLHVWLPDAMEGPTPVSALIHAATMVAAGVYMVARLFPIFEASHIATNVVLVIGMITAFMAATIALVQVDIKKVMAYSTISQLGYMMMGLGALGRTAAMFHLTTHAMFKALLFLCAGSVIHAMHHAPDPNDMRSMGGLLKRMPITAWTCGFGVLALAGIPPFSGFWSKDAILAAASNEGGLATIALYVGIAVAGITAFYSVRMWMMTFAGAARSEAAQHAHESPALMIGPLVVLAVPSVILGGVLHYTNDGLARFLSAGTPVKAEEANPLVVGLAIAVAVIGAAAAWKAYADAKSLDPVRRMPASIYRFLVGLWGMDAFWNAFGARATLATGRIVAWIDRNVVDRYVANGPGWLCGRAGAALRKTANGQAQSYVGAFVTGVAVIAALLVVYQTVIAQGPLYKMTPATPGGGRSNMGTPGAR
jgi:NADH-quinone oxidoreductase subunit L